MDTVYHLTVDDNNTETWLTIFELEATTIQQTDQTVPKSVIVEIRAVCDNHIHCMSYTNTNVCT